MEHGSHPNAPDDPDLPITGPNLLTTISTATLLILTGAALVRLTRRHRQHNTRAERGAVGTPRRWLGIMRL